MFYERLNQLCQLHHTNITEVAVQHLGVASSAPTSWKKGASPRSDIVIRAAKHFNVSADYLLGLSEIPNSLSSHQVNAAIETAALKLSAASPAAQHAAIAALEAVIDTLDPQVP